MTIVTSLAPAHNLIARTGRVQSWIDDPTSRLPVSCTVFVVNDSMEGPDGIEASWRFVSHALRYGAGVAVHLSNLRARGSNNGTGLVASGPCSFGQIYSSLNQTLRRGGVYKNGAVVLHLDINHGDILEFVNMPRHELPWAKRCVNLNQKMWDGATQEVRDEVIKGIARGDIWLCKIRYDQRGERIYGNVCLEVFLKSRGTCLLQHVSLGACRIQDISSAFTSGMEELCQLHAKTGVEKTGEYLDQESDRQVGIGMLGLANLLALEGVSYAELGVALDSFLGESKDNDPDPSATAMQIVAALADGINRAARIARAYDMDRAFAIAPTASCSYSHQDREGNTSCPEIAPPIGRTVDRDSSTFGVQQYSYGNVETADTVGWDNYRRVVDGIMSLLQNTGLAHGYSYNSWSDVVTYDEQFVQDWLSSPQTSLYYSLQVNQNTQAKDDSMSALDDFGEFFDFDNSVIDPTEEVKGFCPANAGPDCVACGE